MARVLGLPDGVVACLFDLDGVLTRTASVHSAAWKDMFDGFLRERDGQGFREFDQVGDYLAFVDGKPREDGVRDFLASRGIVLPDGSPDDPPGTPTIHGLGNQKNQVLLERIARDGVEVFEDSRDYLRRCADARIRRAVVSSSANTRQVLAVTGLGELVELVVDGVVARERGLRGKPAPDTFQAAARDLGLDVQKCAVFEDALAGVEAGRAGGFGLVVGVDRNDQGQALLSHGADVVVRSLEELR